MLRPSVLIVGTGLAGLAAARELERRGCGVIVIEARERVGGRVWTLRDGFGGMHAEAGGDLIDDDQEEIRKLAKELGLHESRILHGGFSHYRLGNDASFPPSARRVLALPWKRVFFAGEHTSKTWQGYMNGAVESGLRAAEEVFASTK